MSTDSQATTTPKMDRIGVIVHVLAFAGIAAGLIVNIFLWNSAAKSMDQLNNRGDDYLYSEEVTLIPTSDVDTTPYEGSDRNIETCTPNACYSQNDTPMYDPPRP